VGEAATGLPAGVSGRFGTDSALSDGDRETVVEMARLVLGRFHPKAHVPADPGAKAEEELRSIQ